MSGDACLVALNKRLEILWVALCVLFLGLAAGPAQAGRSVPIDVNTYEIMGDALNGEIVPLSFPVNYGDGAQSRVTVTLPDSFTGNMAAVGLRFTDSPGDGLFASLFGDSRSGPVLMLGNDQGTSRPTAAVANASDFAFGSMPFPIAPLPANSPQCDYVGGATYCYGPFSGSASFRFTDLSSSGSPGDFELVAGCSSICANIGFDLAGVEFSSSNFDPAAAPSQLVSYTGGAFGQGTFDFIFRNPAASAVPEPATWASMIAGFGMLGGTMRRQRRTAACAS